MEDLKEPEIEKLRQIISRTDKSGNEKVLLLMDFIYTREAALSIANVRGSEVALPNSSCEHIWQFHESPDYNRCVKCGLIRQ